MKGEWHGGIAYLIDMRAVQCRVEPLLCLVFASTQYNIHKTSEDE